jgi:hypothetical protein
VWRTLLDACRVARQAGVDEHHTVVGHHEVRVDEQDPDLEDAVGNFPHAQNSSAGTASHDQQRQPAAMCKSSLTIAHRAESGGPIGLAHRARDDDTVIGHRWRDDGRTSM